MARRETRWFACDHCGASTPDYITFGVGTRHYCLETCIPRWVRFKMWMRRELLRRDD